MGRNENISYIKSNPQIYLKKDRRGKGFVCPICGSGTGQNGTGITTKDKVHFTCWTGCFTSVDIIDIIGMEHGLSGFNEKYRKACELYGLDADEQDESYRDKKAFDYVLKGFRLRYGDAINPRVTQEFKYYTHEKKYAFSSFRIDYETSTGHKDKKFFQWFVEANGFCKKLDNKIPAMFGDFEKIKPGIKVIICEGEKDCITYKKHDKDAIVVTCGGSGRWKDNCNEFFRDCEVVVYQDNDEAGKKLPESIIKGIGSIAKSIKVIIPYREKLGGDVTDFFENGGTLEQLKEMEEKTEPVQKASGELIPSKSMQTTAITPKDTVISLLAYKENSKGENKIIQSVRNFEIVLESDVRFIGRIRFNEFSQQTYLIGNAAWENRNNYRPWSSFDDSAAFSILQSDYGLNSRNDYFDAVKNVSMRNRFHPVRELLDSLKWDAREHIRNFLVDYLGVEDSEYSY
ncbi:MAG: toprim domain-containing protein, partial [Ruminococcus flavefaciens]|nr:toprim domain-containing protein [Ruminococcus flavefaciens]